MTRFFIRALFVFKFIKIVFLVSLFQLTMGPSANATFLPEDLIVAPSTSGKTSGMTEAEFKKILADIQKEFEPTVAHHGGKLNVSGSWSDEKLNAAATQQFGLWRVVITGGLARYEHLTRDGFVLIICHELGHHLAGFAFGGGGLGGAWAASEGQSDYFATHTCARRLWGAEWAKNAEFREIASPFIKASCDKVWNTIQDQDLCYRTLVGVESMIKTMATLKKEPMPDFTTPDTTKVDKTISNHPAVQCRMDTSFQGALCKASFNYDVIPGKRTPGGVNGIEAEREASMYSCMQSSGYDIGLRPACWFKARL